jgi:hypothetical protein
MAAGLAKTSRLATLAMCAWARSSAVSPAIQVLCSPEVFVREVQARRLRQTRKLRAIFESRAG